MANYKMNLTAKELRGLLFKKKLCKICGSRLEKNTIEKDLGVKSVYAGGTFFRGETSEYKIEYYCKCCDKRFELDEL